MRSRRLVIIVQIVVLVLLTGGLVAYARHRPPQEVIDDALEDLLEEHGDTYVPVHTGVIERKTVQRDVSGYGTVMPESIEVQLPPMLAKQVKPGATATIDGQGGKVRTVNSAADPETRLAKVVVPLPQNGGFHFGQIVRVNITVEEHTGALTVPAKSIFTDPDGRTFVGMIQESDRWAVLTPVQIGFREGNAAEISGAGLEAGRMIVTDGTDALLPRTRLHLLRD